jgi:hypothetical protein
MAEALGLAVSIASIAEGIKNVGLYIRRVHSATLEARNIANQLEATRAILSSLKTSLDTMNRPQEFLNVWKPSTRLVLANVRLTMTQLNKRLGGDGDSLPKNPRLSFWRKVTWPLEKQDELCLVQQLHGYMQMLSLVQNGFIQ